MASSVHDDWTLKRNFSTRFKNRIGGLEVYSNCFKILTKPSETTTVSKLFGEKEENPTVDLKVKKALSVIYFDLIRRSSSDCVYKTENQ